MVTQEKSEVVHLRLPLSVLKKAKAVAEKEDRTQSSVMIRVLKAWAKNGDTKR